jgi:hypothetical protein
LIAGLGLWAAASAAQPTRMLEEFDYGEDSMVARIVFVEEEHDGELQLCASIGTRRGPRTINRNIVFVSRRVRPRVKGADGRVKFDFGGEMESAGKNLDFWRSCVPTAGPFPEGKEDLLDVTVRGAQANGSHSRFVAPYPARLGDASGVQIHYNSAGGLAGATFEVTAEQLKALDEAPLEEAPPKQASP